MGVANRPAEGSKLGSNNTTPQHDTTPKTTRHSASPRPGCDNHKRGKQSTGGTPKEDVRQGKPGAMEEGTRTRERERERAERERERDRERELHAPR